MKKFNISLITFALGCAFSAGTMAQGMSEHEYKAGKNRIANEYKMAMSGCSALSGNPNDVCEAKAKGSEMVALAELEAGYMPGPDTRHQARIAKAEADYGVAKERCDDMAGNAKDVCVEQAQAAETTAKAYADARMKTSDANAAANEKTSAARSDAKNEAADARKDAAADARAAEYKVAKEKCDTFAGDVKDRCLGDAKARFDRL